MYRGCNKYSQRNVDKSKMWRQSLKLSKNGHKEISPMNRMNGKLLILKQIYVNIRAQNNNEHAPNKKLFYVV